MGIYNDINIKITLRYVFPVLRMRGCRPDAAKETSSLKCFAETPNKKNKCLGSKENGDLTTRKMVILWWFNSDLMGFTLW